MTTYSYRRELTARELLPAIGAGIGAGLAAAYLAQILLRRARMGASPPPVERRP